MKNNNNNNNNSNLSILPIITYPNAYTDKFIIYKENKGKCGVYRWNNIITGKSYVGSSTSLNHRFSTYFSLSFLKKKVKKGTSIIYNALLKYGYSNFSLDILEYCESNILISREQYYIDLLKPEYNILEKAGSRLGAKHDEKTKQLIRMALVNRLHSEEAKTKMSIYAETRKGKQTSFYGKKHKPESKLKISVKNSKFVKVKDVKTNLYKIFVGNKEAAKYLNIGESTLRRYKQSNSLIKGRYFVSNV